MYFCFSCQVFLVRPHDLLLIQLWRSLVWGVREETDWRTHLDAGWMPDHPWRPTEAEGQRSGSIREWGGGISDYSPAVLPSEMCLRSDADCEKAAKYANASCSLFFFISHFSLYFFPHVFIWTPGRNDSAAERNNGGLCAVIAGWRGDALLALLAGAGLSTHHVFTQRLHLVCVSGAHSYKHKGESIQPRGTFT